MTTHPTPDHHHDALSRLEGVWRGIEPAATDCDRKPVGTYDNKFILDGFVMALDYTQTLDSTPCYRMHGLIGWDADNKRYFFHWYDSMGGCGTKIYGKIVGDTLTLEGPDPVQGGHIRFTWNFAENVHTVTIEVSSDQESWTVAMKAEYQREP